MGNVIKCSTCQSYYNGAIYKDCPYCKKVTKKQSDDSKEEAVNKPKRLWGFMGKKNTPTEDVQKTTPNVENNKNVENVTSAQVEEQVVEKKQPVVLHTMPLSNMEVVPKTVPQNMEVEKQDEKQPRSLQQEISRTGRTVGKYISNSTGENIAPVVGWLVGVKGAYQGQSFQLKSGKNKIGRSHEMDVKLLNDESVSRASVAMIIFDKKTEEFCILPGESDSLCYVNDNALYERVILKGYEKIEFGDSGLNKYVFVPFCGEHFSWTEYNSGQTK